MKIPTKLLCLSAFTLLQSAAFADTVINNNPGNSAPQQPVVVQQAPQIGGNQNNIYDPRVPPAGAYYTHNSDGSSVQEFTTGEKKPYYADNPSPSTYTQPYVYAQPPMPGPVQQGGPMMNRPYNNGPGGPGGPGGPMNRPGGPMRR